MTKKINPNRVTYEHGLHNKRLERWEAQQREGITAELWDDMREDTKTLITLMDPLLRLHGYVLRPRTRQEKVPVPEEVINATRWGHSVLSNPVIDKHGNITAMSLSYNSKEIASYSDQCRSEFYVMKTVTYWVVQSLGPSTLDIICNDDRDLLSTVVSILFPERFVDYMQVAIDLTRDEVSKAYYLNEIEKWEHDHAR